MEKVFLSILNMSLTAGIIVIAVLIIRLFLKKLPKKYSYFMWSVVGFRLICPVSVGSVFSIFNLKLFSGMGITGRLDNAEDKISHLISTIGSVFSGAAKTAHMPGMSDITGINKVNTVTDAVGTVADSINETVSEAGNVIAGMAQSVAGNAAAGNIADALAGTVNGMAAGTITDPMNGSAPHEILSHEMLSHGVTDGFTSAVYSGGQVVWGDGLFKTMMVIWIVGMAVMLIYGIAAYIVMARRVDNAVWIKSNVYRSDKITSPFVLGFFKPRVYMPAFIEADAAEYVLLHENYHIQRRDYIVKPIAFIILCVHWFNPLVWAAFYMMGRDMEMSCDEAVLANMVVEQGRIKDGMSECEVVKGYSYALLNCASHGSFNGLFQLGFGEMSVKKRIKNVLKYKKYGGLITAAVLLVCIFVLAACGTNSKNADASDESLKEAQIQWLIESDINFTLNTWPENQQNGITEPEVKIVNDNKGNSIVVWDGLNKSLDKNIIPAGIYEYSNGIDIDGDGEDERILKCPYTNNLNEYKTIILDKHNNNLVCIELPQQSIVTARAFDNFILKIKVAYEDKTRVYDCSNPGKNIFLEELRESLVGTVWDGNGRIINPDSEDGLRRSVAMGLGREQNMGFVYHEGSTVPDELFYNVNVWINDESNIKFCALLKYKPYEGSMIFINGDVLDMLESGETGSLGANFEWAESEASSEIELDLSDTPRKWTDLKLDMAKQYHDFEPCAANIDGEWIKALYNKEQDVLITQESGAYGIYHNGEYLSVTVELPFPTENNVTIKLVDANDDGKDELYIKAYLGGRERNQLIGLEPLTALVDSYSYGIAGVSDYVKEYRLTNVWIAEDDMVHVEAEFIMNDGETYRTECIVAGADRERPEDFEISPVYFDTDILMEHPYSVKQDIRFRVNQGSMTDGNGYIFMSIPLEYDEESNHYTERGDVELYYKEISPADWG